MDFGEVLGRAWRIVWKHKILWIFGFFAGCSRGGGSGGGGGSGNRVTAPGSGPTGSNPFPEIDQYAAQFANWITSHWWVLILAGILFIGLIVLSIWLGTMGRIGLIKGTFKADNGAERLGFGEIWTESSPYFWRVFLLSLLIGLAFLAVLLPIMLLAVGAAALTMGIGILCILPLICLLIPVGIVVGLLIQLAEPAIVLEDLSITDGLRRGWEVFKKNLGPVLIMWLILAVIGFAVGLAAALPILIVLVPAIIAFAAANSNAANLSFTPLMVAGLCFVAYLPVLLVVNSVLTAYLQSAWTLTYMRLTKPKEAIEAPPLVPSPNA